MPPFITFEGDNMKFKFRPNTAIINYDKMVEICTFDENGFFETDNPQIIKYLKNRQLVKVVEEQPESKIETAKPKAFICKYCGHEATNKGALMAHYRIKHPK
jgi:hypothetical protein